MPRWLLRPTPFLLIALALGLSLVAVASLAFFSNLNRERTTAPVPTEPPAPAQLAPPVETTAPQATLAPAQAAGQIRVAALIWSSEVRTVLAPRAGQITAFLCHEGQDVPAHMVLARLDDRDVAVELQHIENRLEVAHIDLSRLEAIHKLSTADLNRYRELLSAGLSSRQDVDRKELEVFQAAMAAEKIRVEIKNLTVEINRLRNELDRCAITAPISGRVIRCLAKETEHVNPGGKICEIANPSKLEIRFRLTGEGPRFKSGDRVTVCAPGETTPLALGVIQNTAFPLLLPNTDEIEYTARLDTGRALTIGMAVEVVW
ncbi:MAG: hypothetical protein K1Y36_14565 [Blastocatellia bacterium]|nr:hypothetical protein [Blastocatellia bacterium]